MKLLSASSTSIGKSWCRKRCQKLYCFLICLTFLSTFSFVYISLTLSPAHYTSRVPGERLILRHLIRTTSTEKSSTEPTFDALEPMKCHLPVLDPFDSSVLEYVSSPIPEVNCEEKFPKFFRTNFDSKLIQTQKMENGSCCYRTMQRKLGTDSFVRLSKMCFPIQKSEMVIPSEHEFITIYCSHIVSEDQDLENVTASIPVRKNYTDMFAFVPLKDATETRVQRIEINESLPPNRLSVVILGLDAQSHMNFKRQMPISYDFLVRNLSAIGLNGYTKVGDNTFPNLVPLLTGLSVKELRNQCWNAKRSHFDACPFIWKNFEKMGYRTSFAEDSVWMGMFNYEKRGFLRQPTDYYLNPFAHQMAKKIGHLYSGNSKLCYGPRLGFEALLDYMVKTSVTFKNKPYFQFIWANSLFHDYLNYPQLGDEMLSMTLQFFLSNGFLNNTLLVLLSDHGIRWGPIRTTYQGRLEERMPLAYFVFPPWFRHIFAPSIQNLELNSNRLTTPFDVYETLKNILDLRSLGRGRANKIRFRQRGISLFSKIPKSRTCDEAGVEEHWCVCNAMKRVSLELPFVKLGAKFMIQSINQLISNNSMCAKLKLAKITSALEKTGELNTNLTSGYSHLQITLITTPGDAIFEATLLYIETEKSYNDASWELAGEISRLSLHNSQSRCISDYIFQKYCFCKNRTLLSSNESK